MRTCTLCDQLGDVTEATVRATLPGGRQVLLCNDHAAQTQPTKIKSL